MWQKAYDAGCFLALDCDQIVVGQALAKMISINDAEQNLFNDLTLHITCLQGWLLMKPETKQVLWEWLPGIAAGLMPLSVFGVVTLFANMDVLPNGHLDVHRSGLTAHFLVLAIVTSTVSTFTAYPRLFSENLSGEAIGRGSLGLVMANTLILVFSASIYTLHEQYDPRSDLLVLSMVVAGLSGLMSLWLEFAIANLRLRHTESDQAQVDSICE